MNISSTRSSLLKGTFFATMMVYLITLSGCQPDKIKNQQKKQTESLQKRVLIPKDTLLSCIAEAMRLMATKDCNRQNIINLFKQRNRKYKMVFDTTQDYSFTDKEVLGVNSSPAAKSCDIFLYIPAALKDKLLFADLKSHFGNWVIDKIGGLPAPQSKIPLTEFIIAENTKDSVHLLVTSIDVPEANQNQIFSIRIFK